MILDATWWELRWKLLAGEMERAVSRGTVMKTDWTCQQTLGTSSPQTQTFKLRIFKAVNVCLCVRSRKLVHVYASSVSLPLPTILQRYHLPPSLSSSQQLFLPVHSIQPLFASRCTVLLYFSRYRTIWLKCLFFVFVYFLCIFCVKNIIGLLQYSTI